jgi:hypothetical protein
MTQQDAELFRYQRLFGTTPDGLQLKVTVITTNDGRIKSASLQMRAVEGPMPLSAHPALWSKPVTLNLNTIGEEFDSGGVA